jgi:hypothetical protein
MTRLFGGLLLAIGILIMTCSGLCTLFVAIGGFGVVFEEPSVILLPLIFGGVPFVLGFGAYKWGRWFLARADHFPPD